MSEAAYLYIALVGEQTNQTLFGLLRDGRGHRPDDPLYPTHVRLLATEYTTRFLANLNAVLPSASGAFLRGQSASDLATPREDGWLDIGDHRFKVTHDIVEAYRPHAVRENVADALSRFLEAFPSSRARVDITGGTKLMSLGAERAAMDLLDQYPDRIDLQYIETRAEVYYSYPPRDCPRCAEEPDPGAWCGHVRFPSSFPELCIASWLAGNGYRMLAQRRPIQGGVL